MPSSKRKQQAIDTKKRLNETGTRMFHEQGYENVTVREIAAESGVSIGTFYHYFKSKDELHYSQNYKDFAELNEKYLLEKGRGSLLERLACYAQAFLEKQKENGIYYIQDYYGRAADQPYHQHVKGLSDDPDQNNLDALQICLKNSIEQGELSPEAPIEELSVAIRIVMHGVSIRYCLSQGHPEITDYASLVTDLMITPILKPYLLA